MANMHLGKWGRSLALRVPRALVEQFGLKEGDPVTLEAIEKMLAASKEEATKERRAAAFKRMEERAFPLPPDYKFDREEANWRPAMDKW